MVKGENSWRINHRLWLLLAPIWLAGMLAGCISRFAVTRISVVDEETGGPVLGANVNCSYECMNFDVMSGPKANTYYYRRTGDDNVLWIFGHGNAPSVHASVNTPPGNYYCGHGDQASFWKISYLIPLPIWLPPMRTLRVGVLKKMNPIPMYTGFIASPTRFNYPKVKNGTSNWIEGIAYDCVVGDWCAPYGRGQTTDLVFRYQYDYFGSSTNQWGNPVEYYRVERKLSFTNPDDGFQIAHRDNNISGRPDDLTAPTEGYNSEHVSFYGEIPGRGWCVSDDTHVEFYFRVRMVRDANGRLSGGHYGRMSGTYSGYLGLQMDYIMNPNPLDTNLECGGKL